MNYKSTYISHDIDTSEVIETFGKLLHQLNAIMNNMDSDNVKRLNTNKTVIKSEDGCTELSGSQIKMTDAAGTKRAVLGNNKKNGKFYFTIYDGEGNPAISLDNDGNAVFTGIVSGAQITSGSTINVGTDAVIGKNLILRDEKLSDDGAKISIYQGTSPTLSIQGLGNRPVHISTGGNITLSGNRVEDKNGKRFLTEADLADL